MAINYRATDTSLKFYRGLHENLPTGSDVVDGAFYLTTDSHRFYVGQKEGSVTRLQELNQSITSVASIAAFRTLLTNGEVEEGRFYYCLEDNVLAVVHNNQVIQINPDHNETLDEHNLILTTITSGVSIGSIVSTDSGKTLEGDFDLVSESTTDLNFVINSNDTYRPTTDALVNATKVYYTAVNDGGNTTYTVANNLQTFASGVTYYERFRAIKVTPAKYSFAGAVNGNNYKLTLTKTKTDNTTSIETVNIVKGDNIDFSNSDTNSLRINATDSKISSVSLGFDANNTGALTVEVTSDPFGSGDDNASITPTIKYAPVDQSGNITYTQSAVFNSSGEANLSVYSKAQTDEEITKALKNYNALYYRGPVGSTSALETIITNGVHNGDVYIVETGFGSYGTGDLIIAQGTENSDGIIASSDISWTHIPSGNDFIGVDLISGVGGGFIVQQNNMDIDTVRFSSNNDSNVVVTTGYNDTINNTGIKTSIGLVWGTFDPAS